MDSTESDWTCFESAEVKKYKKKTVDNTIVFNVD